MKWDPFGIRREMERKSQLEEKRYHAAVSRQKSDISELIEQKVSLLYDPTGKERKRVEAELSEARKALGELRKEHRRQYRKYRRRLGLLNTLTVFCLLLLIGIGSFALFHQDSDTDRGRNQQPGAADPATQSVYAAGVGNLAGTGETDTTKESAPDAEKTDPFSVLFIDCGQGDAALVSCEGHFMLIDGGTKANSQRMFTILKDRGIEHLDMIVATHPHQDHIGGLPGALNYADAEITLCSVSEDAGEEFADLKRYAEANGGGFTVPTPGDTYTLGSAGIEIIGLNAGSSVNDGSIILKITYGSTSFLFAGDAETEGEAAVLDSGTDLSATVLKVGHHGSGTSSTEEFLSKAAPQYAVISVGKDNAYLHPHADTLERLRGIGAVLFRTDLHGDVLFTSDGTSVEVITEKHPAPDAVFTAPEPAPQTDLTGQSEPGTRSIGESTGQGSYIANISTMVFHYPNCRHISQMNENNKWVYFGSRSELIAQGYHPCGTCNP